MPKLCKTCGADETNGEFYQGRNTKCKECMKSYQKDYRDKDNEILKKAKSDPPPETKENNKPNDELMGYILDLKNDLESVKLEMNEIKNDNFNLKNENLNLKSRIENLKNQIEALKISNLTRNITIQSPRIEISAEQVEVPCKEPEFKDNKDEIEKQKVIKLVNDLKKNVNYNVDELKVKAKDYGISLFRGAKKNDIYKILITELTRKYL